VVKTVAYRRLAACHLCMISELQHAQRMRVTPGGHAGKQLSQQQQQQQQQLGVYRASLLSVDCLFSYLQTVVIARTSGWSL